MEAGKGELREYTLADDKGPQDLLLRCKKGVFGTPAYVTELEKALPIFGNASFLLQTKDGRRIVAGSEHQFIVYDIINEKVLYEQETNYVYSMTLSPSQRYLQFLDKIDTNEGTTSLLDLHTLKIAGKFHETVNSNYFLRTSYPLVHFSNDDSLRFRYNDKTIEVYDEKNNMIRVIKTGPLLSFEVSRCSTKENYVLACVWLDNKTNKGKMTCFNQQSDEPFYEKPINKAEEIKIKFSPTSNKFLIELQTYYDPSGKSYYGEFGLYLFNDQINKIVKIKTAQGPVHDFAWDHTGKNFIVISGFMPAEPVLYSENLEALFEFGKQHKNNVIWGNLGRLVCLAGFGNLNGEMDIWDIKERKRIGSCKSNSASHCEWSPEDRKLLTAILTPRLRVDNCYKVFSYTGVLLHKANYDHTELYEAVWRRSNNYALEDARGLSPGRKSGGEIKDEAKFKSFGASLNFDAFNDNYAAKKETTKLAPGQHP